MWLPEVGVAEKVIRSAVVYIFLLVAFRVTGKRQVGQLTPFDLTVLLIVSNVLQNAMIGPDNSIGGGLLGAAVLFFLNGIVARLTFHSRRAERLIEGTPTALVHNGKIDESAMRHELVTRAELHAALRDAGLCEVSEARFAMLEANGKITAGAKGVKA
jgi:uncharacterized membrane protein YcaP (DUF421 family)